MKLMDTMVRRLRGDEGSAGMGVLCGLTSDRFTAFRYRKRQKRSDGPTQ
jgi:hypothetical protein